MLTSTERETLRSLCADEASFASACHLIEGVTRRLGASPYVAMEPEVALGNPELAAVLADLGDSVLVTEAGVLDEPGPRIVYVNRAFCESTGYAPDEVVGRTPRFLQGPLTDRAALDALRAALEARRGVRVELCNYRKDGSPFWVELEVNPHCDAAGVCTHFVAVQRDITARKEAEEALRQAQIRVQAVADSYPSGAIVMFDAELRYLVVGGQDLERVGLDPVTMTGRTVYELFPEEVYQHFEPDYHRALAGETIHNEVPFGDQVYKTVTGPVYDDAGTIIGGIVATHNITARVHAEEALRRSRQQLDEAQKTAGLGAWEFSPATGEIVWSEELFRQFGRDLALGTPSMEDYLASIPERYHADLLGKVERALKDGTPYEIEHEVIWADGTRRWLKGYGRAVKNEHGETVHLSGATQDITERKQAELERERTQLLIGGILGSSLDGVMAFESVRDEAGTIVDFEWIVANEASGAVTGRQPADLLGKRLLEEMPGNEEAGLFEAYVNVVVGGEPFETILNYEHDGIEAWIQLTATQLGDGFTVTFRDISDAKQQERRLQESERLFREAFSQAAIGVALAGTDGRFIEVNEAFATMLGYTQEELAEMTLAEVSHPDEREIDRMYIGQMMRGEARTYRRDKRYLHKDGHAVWTSLNATLVRDEAGEPLYFVGQLKDITERKRAEFERDQQAAAVERANTSLRRLHRILVQEFDNVPALLDAYLEAGCELFDLPTGIVSRIEGNTYTVMAVKSPLESLEPGLTFELENTYCEAVVRTGRSVGYPEVGADQVMCHHPVYEAMKLEAYLSAPIVLHNRIVGTLNFTSLEARKEGFSKQEFEQIELMASTIGRILAREEETRRKQKAERNLRESERRLAAIFNSAFQFVSLLTPSGFLMEANQTILDFAGVALDEVIGEPFTDCFWWPAAAAAQQTVQAAIARAAAGDFVRHELEVTVDGGRHEVIDFSLKPIQNEKGEVVLLLAEGRLVTEVAHVRSELERAHRFTEAVLDSIDVGIVACDADGTLSMFNRATQKIHGLDALPLPPEAWAEHFDLYRADGVTLLPKEENPLLLAYQEHRVQNAEIVIAPKTLPARLISVSGQCFHDEVGRKLGAVVALTDITERRRGEQALALAEAKFRGIVEQSIVGTVIIQGHRFAYVNPRMAEIFGYTPEEMMEEITTADIIHEEDRSIVRENLRRRLEGEVETLEYAVRGRRKDGTTIYVELAGIAAEFDGRPAVIGTALDVTARVEAEQALRDSRAQLALLLEAVPDAFVFADLDRRIEKVNPAFTRLTGYAPEEVLGQTTEVIYADPQAYAKLGQRRFNSDGSVKLEPYAIEYRRKNGSIFTGETVGTPVRTDDGEVKGFIGLIRDVTEREQQAQWLAESEARFRLLAESMQDLVCLHHPDGRYQWVSPSVEDLLGYTPDELVGTNPYQLFHPEDIERIAAESHAQAQQGSEAAAQYRIRRKDGSYIWFETLTRPRLDETGQVLQLQTTSRDISERKAAEAEIQEQRRRLELALVGGDLGLWDIDCTTSLSTYNARWAAMLGYALDEIEPTVEFFHSLIHPDDLPRLVEAFDAHARGETEALEVEMRMRARDGSWRWILDRGQIITRTADGKPERAVGTHMDLTERKRAELELRENEALLTSVIDSTADFIWSVDDEGRLQTANRAAQELLEIQYGRAVRRGDYFLNGSETRGADGSWQDRYARAMAGEAFEVVLEMPTPAGHKIIEFAIQPIRSEHGEHASGVLGATVFGHDVTEHRRLMKMKDEFVSTVSHELRTPLTSIKGALGLLEGGAAGPLDANVANLVGIAHKNSNRLVLLINDILDIEKIESGRMSFDIQQQPLQPLLEEVLAETQPYADQYGITFRLEPSAAEPYVNVDRDRLVQVMNNLLSNAAKFSPRDGVVTVGMAGRGRRVRIAVRDEGAGIPADFQPRLFEKFTQADSSSTREKGGTGLGLSICKAIVERHGGQITFESEEGKGTTFFVDLPRAQAPAERTAPDAREAAPAGAAVLIAEDDPAAARELQRLLQEQGYRADVAYSQAQVLRLVCERPYAALMLDLFLGEDEGLELLRTLRETPVGRALRVFVVSVRAERAQSEPEWAGLRVDAWLQKPLAADQLREALAGIAPVLPPSNRVLHIEDDPDVQLVVEAVLRGVAQVVQVATLAEARAALEAYSFDLVLMDHGLPDGEGVELLPLCASKAVPAVLFTAQEVEDVADQVAAVLLKSRTSNEELQGVVRAMLARPGASEAGAAAD